MNSTISYLVTWEIDIEADSPEEAAKLALDIQRDKKSEAISFTIKRQSTGDLTDVDLLDTPKNSQIEYIKEVISKYGRFTTAELQADTSPAIKSIGDMSILIEEFGVSQCVAFTYVDSISVSESNMFYEELEPEVIEDIYNLVREWEFEQTKNQ